MEKDIKLDKLAISLTGVSFLAAPSTSTDLQCTRRRYRFRIWDCGR